MHVRHLVGSCGRTGTAGPQATPALQLVHEGVVIFDRDDGVAVPGRLGSGPTSSSPSN